MANDFNAINHIVATAISKDQTQLAKAFLEIASNNCTNISLLDNIAFLQQELKDYKSCVNSLKTCLSLAPDTQSKFAIRANLAKTLNHLNEPMVSLGYSKLNAAVTFDFDTQMEMAFSYYLMGDYAESEKMMRHLVEMPNLPDDVRGRIEYNLGSYDIERGEFKKGLKGFVDVGHRIKIWHNRFIDNIPVWNGENVSGKTVLIHAEGGIGDELINVRFMNNLKRLGANPVWITGNKSLCEVFNRNGFQTVTSVEDVSTTNSVQCMAMYLPILLNLDSNELWNGSYLGPSEEYLEKWRKLLPEGKKLVVKWSGNPFYDQDLHRAIPLDHINNVQYSGTKINLQLEPELYQPNMFNAGEHITSIEDTLALLSLCDDLITSCTSVAHMNGALGKNGVICPPIASYYVWLGESKWYDDSLKVVRQTKHKDWKFVETVLHD